MKAANDNDPLPFIQIAAAFANWMTYLSLQQKKPANDCPAEQQADERNKEDEKTDRRKLAVVENKKLLGL